MPLLSGVGSTDQANTVGQRQGPRPAAEEELPAAPPSRPDRAEDSNGQEGCHQNRFTRTEGNKRRIRQARPCRRPAPVERLAPQGGGVGHLHSNFAKSRAAQAEPGQNYTNEQSDTPPRARTATDEGPPPPHRGGAGVPHTPPADFTKPAHGGRPASPGRRGGGMTSSTT